MKLNCSDDNLRRVLIGTVCFWRPEVELNIFSERVATEEDIVMLEKDLAQKISDLLSGGCVSTEELAQETLSILNASGLMPKIVIEEKK